MSQMVAHGAPPSSVLCPFDVDIGGLQVPSLVRRACVPTRAWWAVSSRGAIGEVSLGITCCFSQLHT